MFSGEKVHLDGYVTLHLIFGTWAQTRMIKVDFLVIDYPFTYNMILGRPTLNKIGVIISIACLTMKFFTNNGEITTVSAN